MPLSADSILERMKLKSSLNKWRALSIISIIILAIIIFPQAGGNVSALNSDYIARIEVDGIIMEDNARDGIIRELAKNNNVKALIVYINSPGGTMVGGDMLYNAILEVSKVKPVVAVMGSLAASGGYMTAIAADYIVANPGTITGSIGVMLQSAEFTDLAAKAGVNFITFKSAELKGSPSPFEKVSDKARSAIQSSIDDSFNIFVDMVKERRKLSRDKVLELADGRIYTGRQALKNKLVDANGGEEEALAWLHKNDIDAKLPVKDVETKKEKNKLLKQLSSSLGISNPFEAVSSSGLMTIWNVNGFLN